MARIAREPLISRPANRDSFPITGSRVDAARARDDSAVAAAEFRSHQRGHDVLCMDRRLWPIYLRPVELKATEGKLERFAGVWISRDLENQSPRKELCAIWSGQASPQVIDCYCSAFELTGMRIFAFFFRLQMRGRQWR